MSEETFEVYLQPNFVKARPLMHKAYCKMINVNPLYSDPGNTEDLEGYLVDDPKSPYWMRKETFEEMYSKVDIDVDDPDKQATIVEIINDVSPRSQLNVTLNGELSDETLESLMALSSHINADHTNINIHTQSTTRRKGILERLFGL